MTISSLGGVGCGSFLAQTIVSTSLSLLYNKHKVDIREIVIEIRNHNDTRLYDVTIFNYFIFLDNN